MSSINTENFIAPAPVGTDRSTGISFSTELSTGESFGEHFRQAFQTDASAANASPSPRDRTSKTKQDDRSEHVRREQHDRNQEDSIAGDALADRRDDTTVDDTQGTRSDPQDSRRDLRDAEDDSSPSDSERTAITTDKQDDADQAQDNDAIGPETPQTQTPLDGAELVNQLIAENSQQIQQADLISEHYADQQFSNTDGEQSLELVENPASVETTLQTVQSQTGPTSESDKPAEQLQNNEQALDVDLTDATAENSADTGMDTPAEETAQQIITDTVNSKETFTQDVTAQSQAATENQQQENRRTSDRVEENAAAAQAAENAAENAAEKAAEAGAQAAVTSSATDSATVNRDQLKLAKNAVEKIVGSDAGDKDMGEVKTTSSQTGQNDISPAQRAQSVQDARVAAASGTVDSEEIDTLDRVRFVQRVARAVEGAGRDGRPLRIRLHPSELGSLRLEVTIRDGALTARMETETQAAKNILLDSLPALRDRLAQQDIKVQQFDIDYTGSNNDGSAQREADQYQAHDRSADRSAASRSTGESENSNEETQTVPRPRRLGGAAQLDFVV